jgi:DUF4097 and DUF4098 domain-containing protein YvlB
MSNDVRIPPAPSTEVAPPSDTRPPSVSAALAGLLMPILALVAGAALIGAGFWAWSRWVEPETIETTTAAFTDPIQRIVVTSDSGSIEVAAGGEDVRLERISRFRANRPSVTEEVVDGVLHIEVQCPSELFFSSCSVDYQVTAPAPVELIVDSGSGDLNARGLIGGVHLATSSGTIEVEGVAGETSLDTGSGDIRGRDLDVPVLTATTSSGSIEIGGDAGEASLETGSGDIRALGLTASSLTAIASSGTIAVEGVTGETYLETGSGDINSESLSTAALTASTSSGSVTLALMDAPTRVEVSIGSGDAHLVVPEGAYAIDLDSSSGDEEVVGLTQDPAAASSIVVHTSSGSITVAAG